MSKPLYINDAAIRAAMRPRYRWKWFRCKPLLAVMYLLAGVPMAIILFWLMGGVR
jgi:hypothetical protein